MYHPYKHLPRSQANIVKRQRDRASQYNMAVQQQTKIDFIKAGTITHLAENKISWQVVQNGDRFVSPDFTVNKIINSKLMLIRYGLFKAGSVNQDRDLESRRIIVQLLLPPNAAKLLECVLAIFYTNKGEAYINPDSLTYHDFNSTHPMIVWIFRPIQVVNNNNVVYGNTHKLFPTDSFDRVRIECEFIYKIFSPLTNLESRVSNTYEDLFNDGKFSDLTIDVNGTEFKVHKAILSARCKVFAEMFEDPTIEFKMNKIEIKDIHADIMQEILRFIYSGKVKDIEKLAFDLVLVADKYELQDLTNLCQSTMINNITLDNITHIFSLLSYIELDELKTSSMKFIKKNRQALKTKEFSDFLVKLSPALLSEIITYL